MKYLNIMLTGMQALMLGLSDNIALKSLNLSWNGIGEKDTVRYILQYLKSESTYLEHLNLSNNRYIKDI